MSIETVVPWILTVFFGLCTLFFSGKAFRRAEDNQVKEDTTSMTMVMAKLEYISVSLTEIKADNKTIRSELNEFRERLAQNEASIKSFHKRMDKIENHYNMTS